MSLTSLLASLPAWLVLLAAFVLPAGEASTFLGVIVPGETAVLVGGAFAQNGRLPLVAVIAVAVVGAVVGDQIGFHVGRKHGGAIMARLPRWVSRHAHPDKVLRQVRRRGGLAVLVGRWTASLRAFVPGIAGMSGISARRFTVANTVGGVIWAVTVGLLGYAAGASLQALESRLSWAGLLAVAGAALAVTAAVLGGRILRRVRHRADEAPVAEGEAAVEHLAPGLANDRTDR